MTGGRLDERLLRVLARIDGKPGETARRAIEEYRDMLGLIASEYGMPLPLDNWKDAANQWARVGAPARAVVEAIDSLEEALAGLGRLACIPIPNMLLEFYKKGYQSRELGRILSERALINGRTLNCSKEPIDLLFRDIESFAKEAEAYCNEAKVITNGLQKESEFERKIILLSQIIYLLKCPKVHAQWIAAAIHAWEQNGCEETPLEPRRFERAAKCLDDQTIWFSSYRIRQFQPVFDRINARKKSDKAPVEIQDETTRTPP